MYGAGWRDAFGNLMVNRKKESQLASYVTISVTADLAPHNFGYMCLNNLKAGTHVRF